jgi:hypothetical protein
MGACPREARVGAWLALARFLLRQPRHVHTLEGNPHTEVSMSRPAECET